MLSGAREDLKWRKNCPLPVVGFFARQVSLLLMKIAVIDTGFGGATPGEAQAFLPKLLKGLSEKGNEVHLITKEAPEDEIFQQAEKENPTLYVMLWGVKGFVEETAPVLARWLNELSPDVYFIWASEDVGWVVLPLLNPQIATVAIGHEDSEYFYLPARHYRSFLTRLVGVSPEVCIGYVLSSVIEKEKVEWIPYRDEETEDKSAVDGENLEKLVKNYLSCFETAIKDARAAPRQKYDDYPLMETVRSRLPMWLRRLKAKMTN
jgi:hypothetical protein